MSAKVRPAGGSNWFARCEECDYISLTGSKLWADSWAAVHNEKHHKGDAA